MRINFDRFREEFSDEAFLQKLPGDESIEQKRKFTLNLVDLMEIESKSYPFKKILGYVCEQARQNVLAESLRKIDVSGKVEKIIHGSWLTDIEADQGKHLLKDAIKNLPHAALLRMTLCSLYLHRIYWSHWKKDHKITLLEAANDAIRPLGREISASEMKKLIKSEPSEDD